MKKYKIIFRTQSLTSSVLRTRSGKSLCFQNADFHIDCLYFSLGHHILKCRWIQFSKTLKNTFYKGNFVGSLLFLWEVKQADFGSRGRFRIVLKGLICFRLDALHILQLLEGSSGSSIGTARAKQGQCNVQWVHECGARSATRKGRGSIWVSWADFPHQWVLPKMSG